MPTELLYLTMRWECFCFCIRKLVLNINWFQTLPSGWKRKVSQRKSGASAGRYEVFIIGPSGKRFRSRNELKSFFEKTGENTLNPDDFDFSTFGRNNPIQQQKVKLPFCKHSVSVFCFFQLRNCCICSKPHMSKYVKSKHHVTGTILRADYLKIRLYSSSWSSQWSQI